MSANDPRQELDLRDEASVTSARASESPTRLEDSPTVNRPEAEISPATRSRADLPANPGAGMMMDTKDNPMPATGLDGAGTMTRPEPPVEPGAPFPPGMGAIVDDVAGDGRLDQGDIGNRQPGAAATGLADHGGAVRGHEGTIAGLDETTGTDDPSAMAGDTGRRGDPR